MVVCGQCSLHQYRWVEVSLTISLLCLKRWISVPSKTRVQIWLVVGNGMNHQVNIYDSDCTVLNKSNAIKCYYQYQYPSFYSCIQSSIHPLSIPSFHSSIHGDNYGMDFTRQWLPYKGEKCSLPLKDIPLENKDKIANYREHTSIIKNKGLVSYHPS